MDLGQILVLAAGKHALPRSLDANDGPQVVAQVLVAVKVPLTLLVPAHVGLDLEVSLGRIFMTDSRRKEQRP